MKTEKATVVCESVFSDDKEHRYILKKQWDKTKPTATIITLMPSVDYNVCSDLTSSLIQNNIFRLGMGGFELVNLFSKIGTEIKGLIDSKGLYDKNTDKYIIESCNNSEKIVIAWGKIGTKNKVINERIVSVINLLLKFPDKLYFISDGTGRSELHPLTPAVRREWYLVKAVFEPQTPTENKDEKLEVVK